MTLADPPSGSRWLLIGVLGVGTFVLRLSFIQLYAWLDEFPPAIERALGFVPAAVLAALVFPNLFSLDSGIAIGVVNARSVAGGAAAIVAWRTESMTATIVVGMAVLLTLQFLFA